MSTRATLLESIRSVLGSRRATREQLRTALKAAYDHMDGNQAGRPSAITEDVAREIDRRRHAGETIVAIAAAIGVSKSAVGEYLQRARRD